MGEPRPSAWAASCAAAPVPLAPLKCYRSSPLRDFGRRRSLLDVGSRTGAILFGAHCYANDVLKQLRGIEFDAYYVEQVRLKCRIECSNGWLC